MKIGVISSTVFKIPCLGYSGLEIIAWQCAKGLAEKGHQVAVFAPEGSTCPGCSIVPFGPQGQTNEQQAFSRYWQHIKECDVVIDHSWNKWSMMLKIEKAVDIPVLMVMHAPVNTMMGSPPPGIEKPCYVCISMDQANHLEALYNVKARVCYNGVDLDVYKSMDIPRTKRFLFLARFSTIKGPDLAIEACLKAGVELDLVGDTTITGEPELLAKCQSMADGKQIRIVGGIPRGECVWWYSQAHAMVHPNARFKEPFGLAPVEALACGCPVIAWDYGAMRETVEEGDNGFLVRSTDELVDRIRYYNNEVPDWIRGRCREWANEFGIQRMVNRYEELCTEALKTGGW